MKSVLYAILIMTLSLSVSMPLHIYAAEDTEPATVAVSEDEQESTTAEYISQETTAEEETTSDDETTTDDETTSEDETTSVEDTTSEDETTSDDVTEDITTEPSTEPTTQEPVTDIGDDDSSDIEGVVSLEGKTIMIVGNSMLYYGKCVIKGNQGSEDFGYFYQLVASNGEQATVIDHTYSGARLDEIYRDHLSKLTPEERDVDYVVLSEAFQENNDLLGTCRRIMALFPEKTQFRFMCHPMMYDKNMLSLVMGVDELRRNGIQIVDWGKMVYDIYTGVTTVPDALYKYERSTFIKNNTGDFKHPNLLSGYLAAQMLYTSITNRSAVFADYSFCDDSSIHKSFDIDAFVKTHYAGPSKTNFDKIFRSAKDMLGLQKTVDLYLSKEGKHPLTVLDAVEPTCTSGGLTMGSYCAICGETAEKQEYIRSKGGHKYVFDDAVEVTCTTAGKTAGIHCSVCNEVLIRQKTTAASGHKETKQIVVADKNKDGAVNSVCTVCNQVVSTQKINKIKSVTLSENYYIYNNKAKTPTVIVTDTAGNKLSKGVDYSVTLSKGRKKIGDYIATVKFKGNYGGTEVVTFKIRAAEPNNASSKSYLKSIKLSWESVKNADGYRIMVYDPSLKTYKKVADTTKLSYKVKKLTAGKKYKFRIISYTKVGGKIYYGDEFRYIAAVTKPATVGVKSAVSSKSGTVTVNWNKVSGANGYQIAYSTSSSFTGAKTATFKKQKTVKATVKNLSRGRYYYFKVRAYKNINGKKVYGAYSKLRGVTVKY